MEKLKPYLLKIQQHHFWILIVVAIVALFYAWNAGTAELEKSFKKNKSSIDRQFTDLKNKSKSRGGGNFPNDKWIEKQRELTGELTANGKLALKNIREVQGKAQTWPQTLHPDSKIEIEEDRWTADTVADYIDAASEEIDRFRIMLDAADGPDDAGIFWNEVDFDNLKQSVNTKDIQAEKDCKIFQQVLWVYEALVIAIQQTNAGAEDSFDLPIYAIKDTAVFQEASESIDETAWMVREDIPDIETKKEGKKTSPKTRGKTSGKKKSPVKFQPTLRTIIGKPVNLEGYDVIAFRLQVRMQIDFLEALLRSLANTPIPMVLEGIRFRHLPDLEVVKSAKPEIGRRTSRRGRNAQAAKQKKKGVTKTVDENTELGSLVEIWGFAYLAKVDSGVSDASDEGQATRTRHIDLTVSK